MYFQNHPNITQVKEVWEWNNVCFLVLEYCSGGELFHYFLGRKHLTESEVSAIMKQLLSALAYLHSQNIIHGEIKPENFMLATKEGPQHGVKIIDFGLTKEVRRPDPMKVMRTGVSNSHFLTFVLMLAVLYCTRSDSSE